MEFGGSSRLDGCGANVVGLSWVSAHAHAEGNLLLATSEARVAVYSADDRRVVASWITRPGSYNKFTCAAVQNRLTRRFFCVQNYNRLFSWHEKDATLERATKLKLRSSVYALRQSKKLLPILVVYADGGFSIVSDKLAEVAFVPAPADGSIVTWARLTGVPTDDRRFVLMLLKQQPLEAAGREGEHATAAPPYVQVYTITVSRPEGAAGAAAAAHAHAEEQYTVKAVAKHVLHTPAASARAPDSVSAATSARVTAIALHKVLNALSVVWSTGHMQVLQFSHSTAWYATTPTTSHERKLARFSPDAPAVHADADESAGFHCAAFALEPSCFVLAGESGGSSDVGLSVWDARYGVMLGCKQISAEGDDGITTESSPAVHPSESRSRSASVASMGAPPSAADVGSLLSSAQAVSSATLTPDSVFQVTVSEDNSFVAVASRRRVLVTAVAARGASLLSAVGRMGHTRTMLAADDVERMRAGHGDILLDVPPVPQPSLTDLLCGLLDKPSAEWSNSMRDGWLRSVKAQTDTMRAASEALMDRARTPTAAHILSVLIAHGDASVLVGSGASADESAKLSGSSRKRARAAVPVAPSAACTVVPIKDLEGVDADGTGHTAVEACAGRELDRAPTCLVSAVIQRCVQCLQARAEDALQPVVVLRPLLRAGVVSAVTCPSLVPAVIAAMTHRRRARPAVAKPAESSARKRGRSAEPSGAPIASGSAPTAESLLHLFVDVLTYCRDVPESMLVSAFTAVLHSCPMAALARIWRSQVGVSAGPELNTMTSATKAVTGGTVNSRKPSEAPLPIGDEVLGLCFVTALIVRAPRNDVFLEQALAQLPIDDVTVLLGCLQQLLQFRANTAPEYAAENPAMLGSMLPTYAQVVDWIRMTVDAHFTRLLLASKSTSGQRIATMMTRLVAVMREQVAFAESASAIRSQLLHIMARGPLPTPPPPDHIVHVMRL